eukprot:s3162_g1.t1
MDRKLTLKRIQCLVVEYSLCRCISGKSYESQETSEDVCVSSFRPVHRVVHWGADGKDRYALSCWYVDTSEEREEALARSPEAADCASVHHELNDWLQWKHKLQGKIELKERALQRQRAEEEEARRREVEREEERRRRAEQQERLRELREEREKQQQEAREQRKAAAAALKSAQQGQSHGRVPKPSLDELPKEPPHFAELRLLEQTLAYCRKLLPKDDTSEKERKPVEYNNPEGSLVIMPKEDRPDEFLFAPPKPRRHEGKVRKRPPTSKMKKTRTEGKQTLSPKPQSMADDATDLTDLFPLHLELSKALAESKVASSEESDGASTPSQRPESPSPVSRSRDASRSFMRRRRSSHGIEKPCRSSNAPHQSWAKVHLSFSSRWRDEIVQILGSSGINLRDEGRSFRVEDCKGRQFNMNLQHQERSHFPMAIFMKKLGKPAWQELRGPLASRCGRWTRVPIDAKDGLGPDRMPVMRSKREAGA